MNDFQDTTPEREAELAEQGKAQEALDLYPDALDAYWDSAEGQDTLETARAYGLKATTTNRERIQRYRAFVESCLADERRQS